MPMPLVNRRFIVNRRHQRSVKEIDSLCAETHATSKIRIFTALLIFAALSLPLGNKRYNRMRCTSLKLRTMCICKICKVPCCFYDSYLHTETDTQIWHLIFSCITNRLDLTLDAAITKARLKPKTVAGFEVVRKTIDARKGKVRAVVAIDLRLKGEAPSSRTIVPAALRTLAGAPSVVIVGAGPGGMFCAWALAKAGMSSDHITASAVCVFFLVILLLNPAIKLIHRSWGFDRA